MHTHKKGLSCSLNRGNIRLTGRDGKSKEADIRKGDLSWSDVDGLETHSVENLGGALQELCVELKD